MDNKKDYIQQKIHCMSKEDKIAIIMMMYRKTGKIKYFHEKGTGLQIQTKYFNEDFLNKVIEKIEEIEKKNEI
jgi:hypothetical protein